MRLEAKQEIATLWLDRPPANAIDMAGLVALEEAVQALPRQCAKVLLVRSGGRFFSAGADINMLASTYDVPDGAEELVRFAARLQLALRRLRELPTVSIAVMQGMATGGGLEVALACDLRIGVAEARYGLPEIKLGLVAGAGGTQALPRLVGPSQAARLILTGELIDGNEAHRIGLLQYLKRPDEIDTFAQSLAAEIAALPAAALAANKHCLALAGSPDGFAAEIEQTRTLHRQPETRQRLSAFVAQRGAKGKA
jgi:enoyl-CoA hydratase/carnithine racemase